MVMDVSINITSHIKDTPEPTLTESFWPFHHQFGTLPINGINNYFQDMEVSFNHHTTLHSDRLDKKKFNQSIVFLIFLITRNHMLDFDGWGFIHAIEQNLHANKSAFDRKRKLGKQYRERNIDTW